MRIWKYQLRLTGQQSLIMPKGAEFLSVQMQGEILCLWALVDEYRGDTETTLITLYGTGHRVPRDPGEHIATVQCDDGSLVFHVFAAKPYPSAELSRYRKAMDGEVL